MPSLTYFYPGQISPTVHSTWTQPLSPSQHSATEGPAQIDGNGRSWDLFVIHSRHHISNVQKPITYLFQLFKATWNLNTAPIWAHTLESLQDLRLQTCVKGQSGPRRAPYPAPSYRAALKTDHTSKEHTVLLSALVGITLLYRWAMRVWLVPGLVAALPPASHLHLYVTIWVH